VPKSEKPSTPEDAVAPPSASAEPPFVPESLSHFLSPADVKPGRRYYDEEVCVWLWTGREWLCAKPGQHHAVDAVALEMVEERLRRIEELQPDQEHQLPRRGSGARQAQVNRRIDLIADYHDRRGCSDRDIAGQLGNVLWGEWYARDNAGNPRKFDRAGELDARKLMEKRVASAMKRLRKRRQNRVK
jgi:hypothetical protein